MQKTNRNSPCNVTTDKFWNFVQDNGNSPPELLLYGPISSQQSWWEDRITPNSFNKELADLGEVDEIIVRINSGGGDVFAANAIYTRLKDHSAKITVKIDGWAASAATIIAMAGDTIKIASNGIFMIHDPAMTVWDSFTAEEFEKMASELRVIKQSIVNSYAMKTGRDEEEIARFMAEEKWWTGDEAVTEGFCDELMFEAIETNIKNKNCVVVNSVDMDLTEFKTIPKFILNKVNTKKIKDREDEKMSENKITTVDYLRSAYPDLVNNIEKIAIENERNRIKDIKKMSLEGFEDIVEDAMFENPISAEKVAVAIVNKQKQIGGVYLNNREIDVENSGMGNIGTNDNEHGREKTNVFEAVLDKLYPETK
ncbi:MAG: Clp protease ClpP [Clostridia bacterium]|nr:Clp protease ClpP [Clostridia bacterium]